MQEPSLQHPGGNSDWNKQIFESTGLHTWNEGEVGRGETNSFKSWRRLQTPREMTHNAAVRSVAVGENSQQEVNGANLAGNRKTSYTWVFCSSCRSCPPPHHRETSVIGRDGGVQLSRQPASFLVPQRKGFQSRLERRFLHFLNPNLRFAAPLAAELLLHETTSWDWQRLFLLDQYRFSLMAVKQHCENSV